jgi:hypothetical protein
LKLALKAYSFSKGVAVKISVEKNDPLEDGQTDQEVSGKTTGLVLADVLDFGLKNDSLHS